MSHLKEWLQHDEKSTDSHLQLPLDQETIERFKACKRAQFPVCLDKSVTKIFGNKDAMLLIAARAGFEATEITSFEDVWNLYMKLGDTWEEKMGSSVTAVIRHESLKEMESMGCTKCPLYEMELEKKNMNSSL
ncbi:MAG: hypothetical protein JRN15_19510 [Nitrososphaerota archaeon]|nr:hypothetical protein [Nitrososphaerota archaeon]